MIRSYVDIRTQQIAAGATAQLLTLAPRDRKLVLRLQHLYLAGLTGLPPALTFRLYTDIPGLSELHGLAGSQILTGALPIFADLPGDARGTLSVENLTGAAAFTMAGLSGYYLEDESEEELMRPRLESPSFVRASATLSISTAGDTEMLRFQTPNYRGGVVITGIHPIQNAAFNRCTITFEGPGLESVGPVTVTLCRPYPFTLWLPPLGSVRVLMRRETGGAVNAAIALHGYGLP